MLQQKSEILAKPRIKNSKDFKKFFLLQFTKELIKHSEAGEVFELENVLKKETYEKDILIQLSFIFIVSIFVVEKLMNCLRIW